MMWAPMTIYLIGAVLWFLFMFYLANTERCQPGDLSNFKTWPDVACVTGRLVWYKPGIFGTVFQALFSLIWPVWMAVFIYVMYSDYDSRYGIGDAKSFWQFAWNRVAPWHKGDADKPDPWEFLERPLVSIPDDVPSGLIWTKDCAECAGSGSPSGSWRDDPCDECRGAGRVVDRDKHPLPLPPEPPTNEQVARDDLPGGPPRGRL